MNSPARSYAPISMRWQLALLGLIIAITALVRFHFRNMPLERDEGEYAYAGQLVLHGIPPYTLLYNMKLPGTYAAYAVIMGLMGQSISAIHIGLLIVNSSSAILLFFLTKRFFGVIAGLCSCAAFCILSISPSVLGLAAHATQFVVLPGIGGLLLLQSAMETARPWRLWWSGVLLGLAFVMKQPGLCFAIVGGIDLLSHELRCGRSLRQISRRLALFAPAVILPFALVCIVMLASGEFGKFWFWTISYAGQYNSMRSLSEGVQNFWTAFSKMVSALPIIWSLAGVGLIALIVDAEARRHVVFAIGLLFVTFLGVCPGLYFREHYFVLVLPAIAILVGIAVGFLTRMISARTGKNATAAGMIAFAVVVGMAFFSQFSRFWTMDPNQIVRIIYPANPFPDTVVAAQYIRMHSSPDARIAVFGSEPEIYFYADRRSATGYMYSYPFMEKQKFALQMQRDAISEIESARPEFVVVMDVTASGPFSPDDDPVIYNWSRDYLRDYYQMVGAMDIGDPELDRWDDAVSDFQGSRRLSVLIYRRRPSPNS